MIKDDIHNYVRYLNIRKGVVEDLMTLINQYKLPLQLNATVFAIFTVAPIEEKQNRPYINPTNAHFVAELVSRLVASAPLFSGKLHAGRTYLCMGPKIYH